MLADDLRGIYYLALKDIRSYYFKPPNISWGILLPVVFLLAFWMRSPVGAAEIAPGLLAMTAMFGATSMEAIVITFERRVGTFQRLMLAPISPLALLLGKILGGAVFGLVISMVMWGVVAFGLHVPTTSPVALALTLVLSAVLFSCLGAFVSVSVREVFEAQTLANFFRFPMVFLCGVFIPLVALPDPLRIGAYFLPLTYSVQAARWGMGLPVEIAPAAAIVVMVVYAMGFLALCLRSFQKELA